jgi:hypothetical protein
MFPPLLFAKWLENLKAHPSELMIKISPEPTIKLMKYSTTRSFSLNISTSFNPQDTFVGGT